MLHRAGRLLLRVLIVAGALALGVSVWLMAGLPLGLPRLVEETSPPQQAEAIICLTGGLSRERLPLPDGWPRIYTAVQLHADGYAPLIVVSGGGGSAISEAEVYADAAVWLGAPPTALFIDAGPADTSQHATSLLALKPPADLPIQISRDTPLLVVTSSWHSRRAALCFRKAGFTNVRVVSTYEARRAATGVARSGLRSTAPTFKRATRNYGDPINLLRWGLEDNLKAIHELVALGVYRWRGLI